MEYVLPQTQVRGSDPNRQDQFRASGSGIRV